MAKIFENVSTTSQLSVKAKANGEAEILIYGVIGGGFFGEGITAKDFQKELKALPKETKTINVRINSPGGSVFDGWTIFNLLKQHPAKVITHVDGLAASIASIIALAGDKIIMGQGAEMMIHQAWTFAMGNKKELQGMVDRLYSLDDQLINAYMKKTKKTRPEIEAAVEAETWYNADQAIDFGLADEKAEDTYAIAASLLDKATWVKKFSNTVLTEKDLARDNATELQNQIKAYLARK